MFLFVFLTQAGLEGHGFVLVFAINMPSTFNDLRDLREQILRVKDRDSVPMVLAGSFRSEAGKEETRMVSYEDATSLADEWGVSYMEISARDNVNVDAMFEQATRKAINSQGEAAFDGTDNEPPHDNVLRVVCVCGGSSRYTTDADSELVTSVQRELATYVDMV
jgi:GTPase SAR1 family protein